MTGNSTNTNLLKHRGHLRDALERASRDFDRAILALAGGGLGLSLALFRDAGPSPQQKGFLAAGWVCLAVALVAILASLVASAANLRRRIKRADADLEAQVQRHGEDPHWVPWQARGTRGLNYIAATAFVTGTACIIVFALANV